MSLDRDFDRIATAWLAEGPDELAVRVLDAVVDEIHQTRQRPASRLPWRFPTMSLPARVAVLVAVGALVLAGALAFTGIPGGRPMTTSTPSAMPTVEPSVLGTIGLPVLDATFTSPWHGYTVKYPAGWTVTPSTAAWMPGTIANWGDPALDEIKTGDVRFVGTSQRLGATTDDWHKAYCEQDPAAVCADPKGTWEPVKISGYQGYIDANGIRAVGGKVAPSGKLFEAVVVLGDHAYVFTMDGNLDRAVFDAFLSTITFSQADAIDLPKLTGTFTSPTYGYSVGTADGWTTTAAQQPWVGVDNESPTMDAVTFTGTDTSLTAASQRLGGQTYDQFLAAFHANTLKGVPSGCDGGEPTTWPQVQVGDQTGSLEMLCNAAEVLVHVGDRVYVFDWGNDTFTGSSHLNLASWKQLLKSITFDPAAAK